MHRFDTTTLAITTNQYVGGQYRLQTDWTFKIWFEVLYPIVVVFAIVGTIGSGVDEEVDECICSVEAVVEDVLTAVTVEVDGCVRYRAEVSRFCLINPIINGSHRLMDIQFGKNDDVADPFEDTIGSSIVPSLVGRSEFD